MDIDLLSKMVKELILDNDEVTLPGVGTFVTEIIPSNFSDKGYTINPPYRRLYFRQKQNENDSQLSDFYAKSNNIDKETARLIISDFLKEMKEILLHKRIIVFPGLGRLRATKENNLFFIADEELDIYPEGFGLEHISLKTHQETTEEVSQALDDLKTIMTEKPVEKSAERITEETEVETPLEKVPAEENPAKEETTVEETIENETPAEEIPVEETPAEESPVEAIPMEEVPAEASHEEEIPVEETPVEKTPVEKTPVEASSAEKPTETRSKKKGLRTTVWIIIIFLIICILALLAFIIVGHVAPEVIDQLLYSPEELEIINNF